MRKVKDIDVNELFQEALKHDKSLMMTERVETIKEGLFRKPKKVSYFTVYHETPAFDGSAYQARFQSSASGSKSIVVAYLYGIINGALSVKNGR
ncbi:MAG: hypothetical protein ACK5KP_11205 [Paludibacteraceae bacterium]